MRGSSRPCLLVKVDKVIANSADLDTVHYDDRRTVVTTKLHLTSLRGELLNE